MDRRATLFGPPSNGNSSDSHDRGSTKKLAKRSLQEQPSKRPFKDRESPKHKDEKEPEEKRRLSVTPGNKALAEDSSSWNNLTNHFVLLLEEPVTIASQKDGLLVAVKEIAKDRAERDVKLEMLRNFRGDMEGNENFLHYLGCFSSKGSFLAVFEHEIVSIEKLSLNLDRYSLIKPYPTESQLATILEPILNGVKYLASMGLEHGTLTCKSILISTEGSIRISHENCVQIGSKEYEDRWNSVSRTEEHWTDTRGVGFIARQLMHKVAKYGGSLGVQDLDRWPEDGKAFDFVMAADSASIDKLKGHPLIGCPKDLIGVKTNVYMAELSTFRGHWVAS